ncbi:uncharacterized protein EHS24_002412 [Apiotrichum porosum]|uniref:Uncharacterized protein n=1 Tax=Apiotrichum porosum TaxID=105984 RepID=A0A427XIS0_9TREE|nr:uncharacterized protein EHS24_002412 [Apiotrichum porosum]RSH78683.1 hypothetical protein EHS24_002412 [Apiotrichum porosum]
MPFANRPHATFVFCINVTTTVTTSISSSTSTVSPLTDSTVTTTTPPITPAIIRSPVRKRAATDPAESPRASPRRHSQRRGLSTPLHMNALPPSPQWSPVGVRMAFGNSRAINTDQSPGTPRRVCTVPTTASRRRGFQDENAPPPSVIRGRSTFRSVTF